MTDKTKIINSEFAPTVKDTQSLDPMKNITGTHLLVALEDIENIPGLKAIVEKHAGFVDFIMMNYYVHTGNKYCPWIAMQLPQCSYVTIDIHIT